MYGTQKPFFSGTPAMKIAVVTVVTILAFIANIAGLFLGLSVITPLLFYLPIVLAAYWFPRQGVLFSVSVGILEVFLVYLFNYPDIPQMTYAVTTASFYVLVAIAIIISSLSGNLREREARYRGIFDHSETGIILARNSDQGLLIEEVNQRGALILGSAPEELAGVQFTRFWRDDAVRDQFLEELRSRGSIYGRESAITRPDGREVPVLTGGSRLPGHMMVLTFTDISTRKMQELALNARNRQLGIMNRVIAEAASAPSADRILEHALGHVVDLYQCDFGGISCREDGAGARIVHQGDTALFSELSDSPGDHAKGWRDALARQVMYHFSLEADAAPQGAIAVAGMVVPIQSGEQTIGTLYLASRRSSKCTTEDKLLVESIANEIGAAVARLRLAEELRFANTQANLYLDILVHDINNANLASLWYGDLLMEMLQGESRTMAAKMIEGIQKSREIIRNLETIRKIQERPGELRAVDLDRVIRKEIQHFPDARISYPGCEAMVIADDLLGEVFSNLIGNSIKFGGGTAEVQIDVGGVEGGIVTVAVSDNGPGIPDELKEVIFRRFSQTERRGSGKGLGLYIVKTLVERYGGSVSVADRIRGRHDYGVVFSFTLKQSSMVEPDQVMQPG